MSRRVICFVGFHSKINQPRVLSTRDRDEAREYRDDIENYDEPRDCLLDLSDVTLIFCLLGAEKPGPASANLRDMEQRGFVYRAVVDFRRHEAIHGVSVSTNTPILPFASSVYVYIYRDVYMYHMEQTRDQTNAEWTTESCAIVSQPHRCGPTWSSCGKDIFAFSHRTLRSLCSAKMRLDEQSSLLSIQSTQIFSLEFRVVRFFSLLLQNIRLV